MKHSRMIILAEISLLVVAAVWGLTFVTVKNAIDLLDPFNFNFYRFSLAAFVMILFALPKRNLFTWSTVKAGFIVGIFLFGGYSFQTVGLKFTTASNAGFFTGLSVILVPVINTIITRKRPTIGVVLGVICAALGLLLFSIQDLQSFNVGDVLVLCCAVCFALHIVFVGRYSPHHHTTWLVAVQIAVVALLSGVAGLVTEGGIQQLLPEVWPALLITALFATCFAFFVQNYMQRFASPSHTAIILASEPLFTAFFAFLLLQEQLTRDAYLGGAFIVAGMIVSEIKALPRTNKECNTFEQQG